MNNWLQALEQGIEIKDNTISVIPRLDKSVFDDIKRVFAAYRGRWVGGNTQSFSFPLDPVPFIDHVLNTKEMPKVNPFSYHPTPKPATDIIFEHTSANPDFWSYKAESRPIRILEPSAGEGALLDEITKYFDAAGVPFEITCIEIDPLNQLALRNKGYSPIGVDFLEYRTDVEFDLVIMNPPFEGTAFVKHIRHAQDMLNEFGRLISIIPSKPLLTSKFKSVVALRDDACVMEYDPLTLDKGTFETAPNIECRVIELASKKVMARDINNAELVERSVTSIELSCQCDSKIYRQFNKLKGLSILPKTISNIIAHVIPNLRAENVLINDNILSKAIRRLIDKINRQHAEDIERENQTDDGLCNVVSEQNSTSQSSFDLSTYIDAYVVPGETDYPQVV